MLSFGLEWVSIIMEVLTKEGKIAKLDSLISEGKNLIVTKSYKNSNYSFEYQDPTYTYYKEVDQYSFPGWRMKSLALLRLLLGGHSIYVKEFEESCKPNSIESHVKHGLGILEAVRSGYLDDTILVENPPQSDNNEATFQIIQVNENRNDVNVEYNVSNFDVLLKNIEESDRSNKKKLIEEIKKIQKELDEGNPTWENVKKWTIFALDLGKDLGINLLANIIAKSANIG